jgi:hypothetical protein
MAVAKSGQLAIVPSPEVSMSDHLRVVVGHEHLAIGQAPSANVG